MSPSGVLASDLASWVPTRDASSGEGRRPGWGLWIPWSLSRESTPARGTLLVTPDRMGSTSGSPLSREGRPEVRLVERARRAGGRCTLQGLLLGNRSAVVVFAGGAPDCGIGRRKRAGTRLRGRGGGLRGRILIRHCQGSDYGWYIMGGIPSSFGMLTFFSKRPQAAATKISTTWTNKVQVIFWKRAIFRM